MRALAAAGLLALVSACATARERSYCRPESDRAAPSAQWRDIEKPASAEALLARQKWLDPQDWRLLHWFGADDGQVSACIKHRGPALFGEEYVTFSSDNADAATAQNGHNNLEIRIPR